VFDHHFAGQAAISGEIIVRLAGLFEILPELTTIERIPALFEAFLELGIIVPLLPGGVACYNALLRHGPPAVVHRSLSALVALLRRSGPHIDILRDSLDWRQVLFILLNSPPPSVTHALTCFANLASYGEPYSRFLHSLGLLDALLTLMEGSVFAVKVSAFECLSPFLALPDIAACAIFDTPLLEFAAGLAPGLVPAAASALAEGIQSALSLALADPRAPLLPDVLAASGLPAALEELLDAGAPPAVAALHALLP
jgi:hypothetical protein